MGDWLSDYLAELKDAWNNLNKQARLIIGIGVVCVFVGLIVLIILGRSSDYQILFSQLDHQDANAIVDNLEERGISYQLADEGRTIKVPTDRIHETRLEMAGEGLPGEGIVGFEIFDETQFGTTDFERQVNFYRALGGELSRSIQSFEVVEFARVQVSAPDDSLFIEEREPAKASVLLELRPGVNLGDSHVRAISNLVSSGVQGLEPENVTIVDSSGALLTADSQEASSSAIDYASNLQYQQQFEEGLQEDLEQMLSRVLGPDNFAIQVRASLNFDEAEMQRRTYSPVVGDEGIIRSQEERTERFEGGETGEGGVPGTTSNIPQYQAGEGEEDYYEYRSTDTVTNYEINERIDRHQYAPGTVEQLSVSVMVDNELSAEQMASIENSVQAAIGYNPDRNDVVNVAEMEFDDSLEEEIAAMRAAAEEEEARRMFLYTGLIIFVLIIVLLAVLKLRPAKEPAPEPGQQVDVTLQDELEEAATEEEELGTELTEEQKKRKKMKEQLEELVYDNPEGVADILKSWLTQD